MPKISFVTKSGGSNLLQRSRIQGARSQVTVTREPSVSGKRPFAQWIALILSLACIPACLLAAFVPPYQMFLGKCGLWVGAMVFAFVAVSVGRYARSTSGAPPELLRLSLRLGYGFLIISFLGMVAAMFDVLRFATPVVAAGVAAFHRLLDSWKESNGLMAKILDQFEWVKTTVAHLFHGAGQPPLNAPSPSPTPAP